MGTPHTTPKDFFMYLGTLVTLYISVGSLIGLIFSVINRYLPDIISYSGYSTSIRLALANLVIIFPVYIFISGLISRDLEQHPQKQELALRRWLTYIHLFVAGAVILGTLVTLINYFLGGEITSRFILKVLGILVVAGGVFSYYIADLRANNGFLRRYKIFSGSAIVLVVVAIVSGFAVIGFPQNQRAIRLDTDRVYDLQNIQSQLVEYYRVKQNLPTELSVLNDGLGYFTVPTDPETKMLYTYTKTGTSTFSLCATFAAASTEKIDPSYMYEFGIDQNWQHAAGTVCFDRTIDPQRYPPIK